jgi:MtN3 and saliva related transmembrane protein
MPRNLIDALGYAAGILTTIAFVPQVWHSWRTRDLGGISLRMYVFFTSGTLLWLIYGIVDDSWPVAIANAITLVFAGLVLVLKLAAVRRRSRGDDSA